MLRQRSRNARFPRTWPLPSSPVQAEVSPEATVIDADEFDAAAQDPGMTEYLRAAHERARAVRHL